MNIAVLEEQSDQLSSKSKINRALKLNIVIAFDIIFDNETIGFAMIKEFEKSKFFLWNFAVDYKFQKNVLAQRL